MGLNIDSLKFLLQARQAGAKFGRTVTLGRQDATAGPERLEKLLQAHGCWPPAQGVDAFRKSALPCATRVDAFLRAIGAEHVRAMDASDYEGADYVHDLNQPVAPEMHESFDALIDGGTLEHVYNFPVAVANCMRMLKEGGHLLLFTPVNNYCGHGFYQFSPDLFYRVLCPSNGFLLRRMIAVESGWFVSSFLGVRYYFEIGGAWHQVADPKDIGKRVTLINSKPVILMIQAERLRAKALFESTPQQSDYAALWRQPQATGKRSRLVRWLLGAFGETACLETLPRLAGCLDVLRWRRCAKKQSLRNREFYRKIRN